MVYVASHTIKSFWKKCRAHPRYTAAFCVLRVKINAKNFEEQTRLCLYFYSYLTKINEES
ncbi:hypothetical protein NBRC111894_1023 [Sporolactobacillus inulinus]|uniref:Uncharacterized protein n=1 Tax=Sporolactobacillus inulinus TaxID=2078 RepID=A0A4Y1Z8T8_9BACL|nr:hypothetical protein NBRC111894_1023 [Sporolactobacillus inulinus]